MTKMKIGVVSPDFKGLKPGDRGYAERPHWLRRAGLSDSLSIPLGAAVSKCENKTWQPWHEYTVNFGLGVDEMIAIVRANVDGYLDKPFVVHRDITTVNYPHDQSLGLRRVKATIVQLEPDWVRFGTGPISYNNACAQLERKGLRPATMAELVMFAVAFRGGAFGGIAALGNSRRLPCGMLAAAYLYPNRNALQWFDQRTRFLAVPIGQVPELDKVRRRPRAINNFAFTMNFARSHEQLVKFARCFKVGEGVTGADYPHDQSLGMVKITPRLLNFFDRPNSIECVLVEMHNLGVRPATLAELLAFLFRFRTRCKERCHIVALGSTRKRPTGPVCTAPMTSFSSSGFAVELESFYYNETYFSHRITDFLVVPIGQVPQLDEEWERTRREVYQVND